MEWRVTAATGRLEHVDHEQWLDAEEELIEALQAPGLAAMGTAGWGPIGHLGTVFTLEAETAGEAAHLGAGLFEKALHEIDVVAALERLEVEPASTDGEELQELEVERRIRTADSRIFQAMTASEVARLLGVSRQRVYQLMTEHPRFPRPAAETPRGAAWDRAAVEEWVRTWDRKPGRPTPEHARGGAGSVHVAAKGNAGGSSVKSHKAAAKPQAASAAVKLGNRKAH